MTYLLGNGSETIYDALPIDNFTFNSLALSHAFSQFGPSLTEAIVRGEPWAGPHSGARNSRRKHVN